MKAVVSIFIEADDFPEDGNNIYTLSKEKFEKGDYTVEIIDPLGNKTNHLQESKRKMKRW